MERAERDRDLLLQFGAPALSGAARAPGGGIRLRRLSHVQKHDEKTHDVGRYREQARLVSEPMLGTVTACAWRRIVGLLVVGLVILLVTSAGVASPAYPRCLGAAARNLAHPCNNPALRLLVIPSPSEAQITPNAPCTPADPTINLCLFGVSAHKAIGPVALVGDSHAGHWRAALEVVAEAMRWQGLSITQSSCPFTAASTVLPQPRRSQCSAWVQAVLRWFAQQPHLSTVFVSDHRAAVAVAPGQSLLAAQVHGYIDVWKDLPPSVKHIVVIRDDPYVHDDTLDCVQAAMARRERPGPACAVPRTFALQPDPAVVAAKRLRSSRVQVVDLTHIFCDAQLCYPVIGGALVYKDSTHLTRVFARTLGPFLLNDVGQLMAAWYRH